MTDDPIRSAAHDLHNHLHALEMGILALTASDDGPTRQKLGMSLQREMEEAKDAAQQLVELARATGDAAD